MANAQWITLTVAGNSRAPVTINDMSIVRYCGKPLTGGTLLYSPTSGAGPFSVSQIYFNLDNINSIGQYFPAPGAANMSAGGNFFAKEVVTLKYHEPQTLGIYVTTSKQYCQFTFKLNIATTNGPVAMNVTNKGHPFSLTSDGEGEPSGVPFRSYALVYAGGFADQQHSGRFMRVNPNTYRGTGNPALFPPR